jgi:hypothetical protein
LVDFISVFVVDELVQIGDMVLDFKVTVNIIILMLPPSVFHKLMVDRR